MPDKDRLEWLSMRVFDVNEGKVIATCEEKGSD